MVFSFDMNLPKVLIPPPSKPNIIGVSAVMGGPWPNEILANKIDNMTDKIIFIS